MAAMIAILRASAIRIPISQKQANTLATKQPPAPPTATVRVRTCGFRLIREWRVRVMAKEPCKGCGKKVLGVESVPVVGTNRTYKRISSIELPAAEVEQVSVDTSSGDGVGESVVSVDEVDAQDLADVSEPSPVKRKWLPFE